MMKITIARIFLVFLIAAVVMFTGCQKNPGSPDLDSPVENEALVRVELPIGSDGGSFHVDLADGLRLAEITVPPGSLDTDILLGVAVYKIHRGDISYRFELTPKGQTFNKPVEISMKYPYFIKDSLLSAGEICPYILSDEAYLCPVYDFFLDEENESIIVRLQHFSSALLAGKPDVFGAADLIELAELLGAKLTVEMIEMLSTVYNIYVNAVSNPGSPDSLLLGSQTVQAWCDSHDALTPGAGWIGDDYIAGYQLLIVSNYENHVPDPDVSDTFIYDSYNNKGDSAIPADDYFLLMVNQSHSVQHGTEINGSQVFDIAVRQERSQPKIEISTNKSAALDQDEIYVLEGRLFFEYTPYGTNVKESMGISGETICFDLAESSGLLSHNSVSTQSDGTFSVEFTADWASSFEEPEISNIQVSFNRGELELSDEVQISEHRDTLIVSTSPMHNASYVPQDVDIEIVFSEAMDLSIDDFYTVTPQLPYTRVWSEGATTLTLVPESSLNPGETYVVSLGTEARSQAGNSYDFPYVFSFTVADAPFLVNTTLPANGAEEVPSDTDIVFEFNAPADQGRVIDQIFSYPDFEFDYSWETPFRLRLDPREDFGQLQNVTVGLPDTVESNSGASLPAPYYVSFQTALVATEVRSISPENGSLNVPLGTIIDIEFTRPMDRDSLEQALSLSPPAGYSCVWDASMSLCRLMFDENLEAETLYTLDISESALDANQNPILSSYSFNFTTAQLNDDTAPTPSGTLSVTYLPEDNPYYYFSGDYLEFAPAIDDYTPQESLEYCFVKSFYTIPDTEHALLLNEEISRWQSRNPPHLFQISPFDTPGRTVFITLLVRDEAGNMSMYPPISYTYPGTLDLRVIDADPVVIANDPEHLYSGETNGINVSYTEHNFDTFYIGLYAATQAGLPSPSTSSAIYLGRYGTFSHSPETLTIDVSEPVSETISEDAHFSYTIPMAGPYAMAAEFSGNRGELVGVYSLGNFSYLRDAESTYLRQGGISQTLTLRDDGTFTFYRNETGRYASKSGTWYGYWRARQGGWQENDNVVIGLHARSKLDPVTGLYSECYDTSAFSVQQIVVGGNCYMQSTENDEFINIFHGYDSWLLYPRYFSW